MPIYEYTCGACRKVFEELVRNPRDERKLICPACGHKHVARQPSVFATHASTTNVPLPTGGCRRCGDPNGPCGPE